MRALPIFLLIAVMVTAPNVQAQGTFVYDQQSADESVQGEGSASIQNDRPAQSFTPSLPAVGFIRLQLGDFNPGNALGASVIVTLRSGSLTGPILGSTAPVSMPDGYGDFAAGLGFTDFIFPAPVAVAPGTTYYFQPSVQSGDAWGLIFRPPVDYPGGTAYFNGLASASDLWFREGIVVPEPSSALLLLLGGGALMLFRRRKI